MPAHLLTRCRRSAELVAARGLSTRGLALVRQTLDACRTPPLSAAFVRARRLCAHELPQPVQIPEVLVHMQ